VYDVGVKDSTPKPRRNRAPQSEKPASGPPRLQKVLAAAGYGSRRECEVLIVEGRVEIDGKLADQLGTRVDIGQQQVRVDGEILSVAKHVYYLLNKPIGIVCTNRDPDGRTRAVDLVPPTDHLFTVGRLDMSSEGLLLVTNDGDLANELAHPRYGIEKIYRVRVAGQPDARALKKLSSGIRLAEGRVRVTSLRVKSSNKKSTELEMVLTEGRNREIRRMAAAIGHKVLGLKRIALGPLRLGEVPSGAYRPLEHRELNALRRAAGGRGRQPNRRSSARSQPGKKRASKATTVS